jgi:hypothetical protein
MNIIKRAIIRYSVKWALRKPIPRTIPLSGDDRLRRRDYFEVRFRTPSKDQGFLAEQYFHHGFTGIWFPERTGAGYNASLQVRSVGDLDFYVRHYFRRYEIEYYSPISYLYGQISLRKYRVWFSDKVGQFFFNRKTLTRSSRLNLLKEFIKNSLAEGGYTVGELTYFHQRFGDRVIYHPEEAAERRYLRYMLESLADSGDLRSVPSGFQITGQAFTTVSEAEQEDRRHKDSVSIQRGLAFLTFCLVVVGALSLDWSKLL